MRVFLGEEKSRYKFDFKKVAVEEILRDQKRVLEEFGASPGGGIAFDRWVRESSLQAVIDEIYKKLIQDGRFVEEREGAVWLKTREDGGKDWVIRRSTGQFTYFLSDIAYHVDKRRRGFHKVIDIWGPDHHAHIDRMKRAMEIMGTLMPELGIDKDWLQVLIVQQVNLVKEGKRVQMSKRAGEYVTLEELAREVGPDAARFFFLMRRCNSHLDFDIDLAKKASEENPVYYVQYAHARISSIIEYARQNGYDHFPPKGANLELLASEEEQDLIHGLSDFEDVVKWSAINLEPHRIVGYLIDIAGRFHRFYHRHRVVTQDPATSSARLLLCWATRTVLRSGLSLIGISAPSSM